MMRREWTKEEEEFLEDKFGTISLLGIAKKLNRSFDSVKMKAYKMDLGDPVLAYEGISVNQLANIMGVHYGQVIKWHEDYGMPVTQKLFVKKLRLRVVSLEDFWKWAETHKQLLNFSRLEPLSLGKEPEWVAVCRAADRMSYEKKNKKRVWTEKEENILKGMVKAQTYSYPEISRRLNRSEAAIKRKLYDMGIKARPVRTKKKRWTEEQVRLMEEMYEAGYGINTIGEKLNKTSLAVKGKMEQMGYKFNHGIPTKPCEKVL